MCHAARAENCANNGLESWAPKAGTDMDDDKTDGSAAKTAAI